MRIILVWVTIILVCTQSSFSSQEKESPRLKTGFLELMHQFHEADQSQETFSILEEFAQGDRFALTLQDLQVSNDLQMIYKEILMWEVRFLEGLNKVTLEVTAQNMPSTWLITVNYILISYRFNPSTFFIQNFRLNEVNSINNLANGMLLTTSNHAYDQNQEESGFEVAVLHRGFETKKNIESSLISEIKGAIKAYFITKTHIHIQKNFTMVRNYIITILVINKIYLSDFYQIGHNVAENSALSLSIFEQFKIQRCNLGLRGNYQACWSLHSSKQALSFHKNNPKSNDAPRGEIRYYVKADTEDFSVSKRRRQLQQSSCSISDDNVACSCSNWPHATNCYLDNQCTCRIGQCSDGYYTAGALVTTCSACPASLTNCLDCTLKVGSSSVICTSCSSGFAVFNGVCASCPLGCSKCTTIIDGTLKLTCTQCVSSLVLQTSGKIKICGCLSNQILNTTSNPVKCDSCPVICPTCTSATACTSCVTGYFLLGSTCTACMPVCKTCSSSSTCTSCFNNFVNISNICTCPTDLFFDPITRTCQSCSSLISNCANCGYSTPFDPANPLSVQCQTPSVGYYIEAMTFNILPCIDYCSNCDSAPAIMCTTPATNFIFDSVTSTCMCDANLFFSVSQDTCLPCSQAVPGCSACQNTTIPSLTQCTSCSPGYFNPTSYPSTACTACPIYCLACTALNACSSCERNLTVLGNGTCGCESSNDLFLHPSSLYCQLCSSVIFNCQNCVTTGFAVTCGTCKGGNYLSNTGLDCYPCPATCSSCTSSTFCTGCEAGYQLDASNQCICGTSCSDCMVNSTGTCASCAYTPSFTCLACVMGYTNTSGSCQMCNTTWPWCIQCTSTCLACQSPFILTPSGCQCNNTAELYLTSNNSTCLACNLVVTQCTSCSGPDPTICLNCSVGYYVNAQVCSPCSGNCLTCSGNSTSCDTCLNTYSMVSPNVCDCNTTGGYFFDVSTGGCSACSALTPNCLTCLLNATNQTQCSLCADSYYWNTTTFKCQACSSSCSNCSSYSYCTSCPLGLIPASGSCVCDNTTVPAVYLDPASGTCQECSFIISGCSSCTDNSSVITCNTCVGSTYLVNNTCANCPSQCATCNSSGCLSCPGTLTLTNGSCICDSLCTTCNTLSVGCLSCSIVSNAITTCFTCTPGTYLSSPNCYSCPSTCATCTGSLTCLTCLPTFILLNGLCSCATTIGMFPNTLGSCESCSSIFYACSQCDIVSGATACTQCSAGYYLSGAGTCLPCDISCPTCSGTALTCTSCPAGETLSANNTCVCSTASCLACSAVSANCTQCVYTIYGNFSLCAVCDSGYYVDGVNCSPCPSVCKSCGASGACLSCAPTFEVINSTCLCNSAKNMWESNNTCLSCSVLYPNCDTCVQNASVALNVSCSQCIAGYYENNSLCVSSVCGDGNITSGQTCDDSNILDGDGCSSFCQIQAYFTCVGSPSVCTVDVNFHITPTTIEVSKTQCNRVSIQFQLSPFYESFNGANFKNMLGFVSEVRLVYKSWQYSKGKVKYDFQYTGTLSDAYTTFYFDPAALQVSETSSLPIIHVVFRLTPTNNILMIYYDQETCQSKASVQAIATAVEYASYGTLIASALPCKIVGLELFGVLQMAHINVGNMDNVNTMMTPFMGMKAVHGFTMNLGDESKNSSSRLLQGANTPARVQSIGYESNFLRNCNVMLFIVIAILLVSAILYTLTYCCKACAPSLHSVSKRIIKEVLLTLLLFNCYNFAYSAGIHFNYAPQYDSLYTAGTIAAVLSIVLPVLMALGLMCAEDEGFGEYKEKFKPGIVERLYFVVTIVYRTGIGLYISTMNQDQLSTLIVMALSIAFLLYNLVNLPYTKAYHNYRANICHLTQFISLFVAMYYRSMKSTTSRNTVSKVFAPAYIQLAFIALSLLVSIIVLAYEIYLFIKECLEKKEKKKKEMKVNSESSVHNVNNTNTMNNTEGNIEMIEDYKEFYEG